MSSPSFVPRGFHTVTPTLIVDDPAGLVSFLQQAFAAEEVSRTAAEDGSLRHATLRLGDSLVEIEVLKQWGTRPAALHLYVPDARLAYERAVEAGAKILYPLADMPYGDREGAVEDRWGNHWYIATHVEDVSPDEMARRWKSFTSPLNGTRKA